MNAMLQLLQYLELMPSIGDHLWCYCEDDNENEYHSGIEDTVKLRVKKLDFVLSRPTDL